MKFIGVRTEWHKPNLEDARMFSFQNDYPEMIRELAAIYDRATRSGQELDSAQRIWDALPDALVEAAEDVLEAAMAPIDEDNAHRKNWAQVEDLASELEEKAEKLALSIWEEQLAAGIGEDGEAVDEDRLGDWIANRTYPEAKLLDAAAGDVSALAEVRAEAGLPVI